AERRLRVAAEAGIASAQSNLGLMHLQGRGAEQSDAEALRWFQRAADQRLPSAQTRLGSMYQYGRGVDPDPVVAAKWYELAARAGDRTAAERLDAIRATLEPEQQAAATAAADAWLAER
ncbi:MAG: tetratricopeptide repeat protein, partial [Planctomycetota bacterium]